MRRLLLAASLALLIAPAIAQTPQTGGPTNQSSLAFIAPTPPNGDNSNRIATTKFVLANSSGSGVTSVTLGSGYGISVSGTNPITTSGTVTPAVNLTSASNALASDVALTVSNVYVDGPSMSQGTTGTWFASGQVTVLDTAAAATINCKLWDGTTVISSSRGITGGTNLSLSIPLSGLITSPAANIRISCSDGNGSPAGVIKFNASGNGKDSSISGVRLQ